MIEFDYLLERNEGDEIKKFKPDLIPKKLKNLSYIEGPNSSGKSTLLNILALGFFGLKNKRLNPSLRDNIKSLTESKHQKIKFSISISNKDGSLKLIVDKPNLNQSEIIVKEKIDNKKQVTISKEAFERKYNLIYDIPDNPTQRLNQLVLDIKDAQTRYTHQIGMLKADVRRIITEIRNARDPERIKTLEIEKNKYEDEISICKKTIKRFNDDLDNLENYTYHRFVTEYKNKINENQRGLDQLNKKEFSARKKVVKENRGYYNNLDYAKRTINDMESTFDEIGSLLKIVLPKKQQSLLKIWERINLKESLEDFGFDSNLEELIISFKKILNEEREELEKNESNKEVQLCIDLVDVLENYKKFNLQIPGIKKTMNEFIADLKKTAEKNDSLIKKAENIDNLDAELAKIKRTMDGLNSQVFPELFKLKPLITHHGKEDYVSDVDEEQKEKLKVQIKKFQGIFEYYENQYAAKGKPSGDQINTKLEKKTSEYNAYTEDQLREKIKELKNKLNEEKSNDKSLNHTYNSIESELERLKKQEPHKYQNQLSCLNDLFEKLNLLYSKLENDFKTYISAIENRNVSEDISDEQKRYNDLIFSFLANKIGKFRHINKEFKATKVDLIDGVIYTKEKKIIHLSDMGTGQGQSAYLKGLLNTSDKRIIIAMFDEIAMMDDLSLQPIYLKFKELYEEGKLLLGLVVQRGNKIKVLSKL
tara:strand:- start:1161 stop:3278 length:2118 start_codon:yes stop_codon:yes gene_type:complete